MYFSKLFVPTSKQDPSDAELASHKLMLKSGMIKKTAAGIYNWLPFGLKVVKKVEDIVRKKVMQEQWREWLESLASFYKVSNL